MSTVAARRFASLLESTFADDGLAKHTDIRKLISAKEKITDSVERDAAEDLLKLVRHDRELDESEVAPSRRALRTLIGADEGHLPFALERLLRGAVPSANVLVKHYAIELDLSGEGPLYPAKVGVTLEKDAPKRVVLEVDPARLEINTVKVRGRDVPFRVEGNRLFIEARGARRIDIAYGVRATDDENGHGLIRDPHTGGFNTLTWPYMSSSLFPSSPTTKDGVTATVKVKTKRGVTVVGAGSDGRGNLQIDAPVPPYAIALYAGKYETLRPIVSKSGVTVTVHGHGRSIRNETRREYQRAVADAIDYFSKWLGKYQYGDHLRLIEVEGDFGGMEHVGAIALMIESIRNAADAVETAVHETAHHWFGDNLRPASSGEFWMSEGFTNYITYRFLGVRDGQKKQNALFDYAKEAVRGVLRNQGKVLQGPDYIDAKEIFTDLPYQLGPWILRMMETELGTEKFDAVLSKWYQSNHFEAVTTKEFIGFVKDETGHDFTKFFRAWSTIDAIPSFKDRSKIDGTVVHIALRERAPLPAGMKIPVVLEGAREKITVFVDPTKPKTIDAGFSVRRIRWDPERRVLADIEPGPATKLRTS